MFQSKARSLGVLAVILAVSGCTGAPSGSTSSPTTSGSTASVPVSPMVTLTPSPSQSGASSPSPAAGAYPDGIPRTIDGQPVLRAADIAAHLAGAPTAAPFLLGGWSAGVLALPCPYQMSPPPELAPHCRLEYEFGDRPGTSSLTSQLFLISDVALPPSGPVVLRVHAHDPLATQCPPTVRSECEAALVIDGSAWTPAPAGAIAAPSDPDLVSGKVAGAACPLVLVNPHVSGILEGNPDDTLWPIWLASAQGLPIDVRWPAGFSVRFTPSLGLFDEQGRLVASGGERVDLPQVPVGRDRGTPDDPYVAVGLTFGTCYVEVRAPTP